MSRLIIIFLFSSFLCLGCKHPQSNKPVKIAGDSTHFMLKVPSQWIEELRHRDYQKNSKNLLREFDSFVKPDKLFVPDYYYKDGDTTRDGLLNPIFANLDGESNDEMVCLMGWDETYPSIAVFKEISGDWYLLYKEPFYMFYTEPELSIANNFSKNKTFYIRCLYQRGSGVYADGYSFYKLINNKVYRCLEMPHENRIYGWGLFLNQEITMDFKVNGGNADEIWFTYHYNYFPGAIKDGQPSWEANPDISLVKDSQGINYQWDSTKYAYQAEKYSQEDSTGLNAQKISCFAGFGNDTLFVNAFHAEINKTLQTGTRQQKRILKQYLAMVKQNGKAVTEEMEETTKTGDTKFYAPKKKKKVK